MIRRSTWIVVVIFAILFAFVIIWQNQDSAAPSEEVAATLPSAAAISVFDIPDDVSIVGVQVESIDAIRIQAQREDGDSDWVLTDPPHEEDTDNARIQSFVGQLRAMVVNTPLETAPSLDVIGLESPTYTVTLTLEDGREKSLYIGNETITASSYYAKVDDGDPQVLSKFDVDAIVNILDVMPVLPTPTPEVEATLSPDS